MNANSMIVKHFTDRQPTMKFTCTKRFPSVPFAHRAPNHDGHCALIHGHNWTIECEFEGSQRDINGFVFDFGKCGPLKEIIAEFDHALVLSRTDSQLLHLSESLKGLAKIVVVPDCSAEGLAGYFCEELDKAVLKLTEGRAGVAAVTIWEDEKNSATARRHYPVTV